MRSTAALRPLLVALALLLVTPLTDAQVIGIDNPLAALNTAPPVSRSDVRIIETILGLDDAQRALTGSLYDDFFERYRVEVEALEAELSALVDELIVKQDWDMTFAAQKKAKRWDDRRLEWRSEFFNDLRLLLNQQQDELWPKVERELRRHDLIGDGRLAGESVDLIRLVAAHASGWHESAEVIEALDRYADRLDRALIERKQVISDERKWEFWNACEEDPYRAKDIYEEVLPARMRVREITVQSFEAVLNLLPEDDALAVERAFYAEALRSHSPVSPIETRMRAAASLPSLSPDQRDRIAAILQEYAPRRHRAVVSFFAAVVKMEAEMLPAEVALRISEFEHEAAGTAPPPFLFGSRVAEQVTEALGARLEIDLDAWRRIAPILTARQRADLPRIEEDVLWFHTYLPHGL